MKREQEIINWGRNKGILEHSDSKTQCLKTVSEVGELADAVAKGEGIEDHVGDIIVTLMMICKMNDVEIDDCIEVAWQEIKDRKGEMQNGTFVKDVKEDYKHGI